MYQFTYISKNFDWKYNIIHFVFCILSQIIPPRKTSIFFELDIIMSNSDEFYKVLGKTENPKLFTNVELNDAQKLAKKHPNTFEAPTQEQLNSIEIGDTVKICDGEERFWTIVKELKEDHIVAEVNNKLIGDQEYNLGDLIQFTKNNIYEIHCARYNEIMGNALKTIHEITGQSLGGCLAIIMGMLDDGKTIFEIEKIINTFKTMDDIVRHK